MDSADIAISNKTTTTSGNLPPVGKSQQNYGVTISSLDKFAAELSPFLNRVLRVLAVAQKRFGNLEKAAELKVDAFRCSDLRGPIRAKRVFQENYITVSHNVGKSYRVYQEAMQLFHPEEGETKPYEFVKEQLLGVCFGMCSSLALRVLDEDIDNENALIEAAHEFADGASANDIVRQMDPNANFYGSFATLLKKVYKIESMAIDLECGLTLEHLHSDNPLAKFKPNISTINEKGSYLIMLRGQKDGHAITFLKLEDGNYLFDPNFGLIRCDKENPQATLDRLMKSFYPKHHIEHVYKYSKT